MPVPREAAEAYQHGTAARCRDASTRQGGLVARAHPTRGTYYASHVPAIETIIRALVFIAGLALVARTMLAAIRALLLPRGSNDRLSRIPFRVYRWLIDTIVPSSRPYVVRDRVLAYYAPTALLVVLVYWLALVGIGFAAMYWAIGAGAGVGTPPPGGALIHDISEAIRLSGSSLLTLGFAASDVPGATVLIFSEAILGLILIALLITYLPTIYSAFSRRELLVNLLEVRADTPPSPLVLLTRFDRLRGLDELHEMWLRWEQWFAELEETHTSLPVLSLYRSQRSELSWVNAAGAILDTAALTRSVVEMPGDVQADLCLRAGYLALQRVADSFRIRYPVHPRQDDPTSISRASFEQACAVLEDAGIELKADRDKAWLDFNGWRVNYDAALLGLARLTMAPPSWWAGAMRSAYVTDEPVVGGPRPDRGA
jgi:hypothetical protein